MPNKAESLDSLIGLEFSHYRIIKKLGRRRDGTGHVACGIDCARIGFKPPLSHPFFPRMKQLTSPILTSCPASLHGQFAVVGFADARIVPCRDVADHRKAAYDHFQFPPLIGRARRDRRAILFR